MSALKKVTLLKDQIKDTSHYPFSIPAIKNLDELEITSNICFFIGENGSGKSTLLEAIATNFGFSKEGGSKNITHQSSTEEDASTKLADALRLSWAKKPLKGYFLRAESFFNFANQLEEIAKEPYIGSSIFASFGGVSLHKHSHGESFLTIFQNQFNKEGFFLLDEPEAALSPQRQLSFLVVLNKLLTKYPNSQIIIATHSPIILAFPNSQRLSFNNGKIQEESDTLTENYQITKSFLNNPEEFLKKLFNE